MGYLVKVFWEDVRKILVTFHFFYNFLFVKIRFLCSLKRLFAESCFLCMKKIPCPYSFLQYKGFSFIFILLFMPQHTGTKFPLQLLSDSGGYPLPIFQCNGVPAHRNSSSFFCSLSFSAFICIIRPCIAFPIRIACSSAARFKGFATTRTP